MLARLAVAVPRRHPNPVVVPEHPRDSPGHAPRLRELALDDPAERSGIPACIQQLEQERLVQLVTPEEPVQPLGGDETADLPDQQLVAALTVLVADRAPRAVQVVQLRLPPREPVARFACAPVDLRIVYVGQSAIADRDRMIALRNVVLVNRPAAMAKQSSIQAQLM